MQETQKTQVQFLGQKDPWRKKWQPIPVFLPGESHGQRSLAGYSPRGPEESGMTERLSTQKYKKKKLRCIKWNTHNCTDCDFKKEKPMLAGSQVSLTSTQQCFWNNLWIFLNFQVLKRFTIFSYTFFLPRRSWEDNYPPFY